MDMSSKKEIGRKLKHLRLSANLSQMGLAEKVGVSFQQIQKYESGKSELTISRLFSIAAALDVAPQEIIEPPEESVKERTGSYGRQAKNSLHQGKFSLTVSAGEMELISLLRMIDDDTLRYHLADLVRYLSSRIKKPHPG
jgi:transcriptional regulator with XRE-family HTH domain